MEYAIFLSLGMFVGAFGTLIGVGGAFLIIPVFIFFMSEGGVYPYFFSAPTIVGTSLFIVLMNALSGTLAYVRQGRIYYKAAVPFALSTLPGAFLGSYVADKFTGATLSAVFGCFLFLVASVMLFNLRRQSEDKPFDKDNFKFNMPLGVTTSLGVGFLSSILGIGGGIIHVPTMIYALGFPVHVATATSHFILAVSASMGVISHALLNHIVWLPAVAIGAGAIIGAQIGASLSRKTKSKTIIILFSLTVYALGIKLLYTALGK